MKKLVALLGAVCMLFALAACAGEAGTVSSANPDNASGLWAEEVMAGVVHDGYAIQAASATEEQLLYAAVYQCYPYEHIEGSDYLSRFALYVSNTGSDGVVWYAPVYVCMPYDAASDPATYADYATAYSEFGRIRMMATAMSMTQEASVLDDLRDEMGWDDVEGVDVLLNYGLYNRLSADGLTFGDEGVSCGGNGDQVLGTWLVEGEDGKERVFYLLDAVGTDAANNLAVAIAEIHLPATMEEDSEDMAVWSELYAVYGLDQWLE